MDRPDLKLEATSGAGKCFSVGDNPLRVLHLTGSWYEMGKQYGEFAKDAYQTLWDLLVQPELDKKWTTEEEARALFGKRVLETSSRRRQDLFRGIADSTGWPVDKVVLVDQCGLMGIYQGKLHSFSGCSSLSAWGDAAADGGAYVARNMDWGDAFTPLPLFLAVYKPNDSSNPVACLNWAGWTWAATMLNDKGVYVDLHDGTSMGAVVAAERPSFIGTVFDIMCECDSAAAVGMRYNATRTDLSTIWMIADSTGDSFSMEASLYDTRKRSAEGSTLVTVNSYLNPDWGLHSRDTISNSFKRLENLEARAAEADGSIDTAKLREIFDLRLFNDDGSFAKNGGATKPKNQDVDLTNHQIVANLGDLRDVWLKIPQLTDWIGIDLKSLFAS